MRTNIPKKCSILIDKHLFAQYNEFKQMFGINVRYYYPEGSGMRMVESRGADEVRKHDNKLLWDFLFRSRNKIIVGLTAALLMVIVCLSVSSVVLANNKKAEAIYRYYTSIEIMPGDSLWSIANEYCFDMNMSINDYINEIKTLNHLSSDAITSGQYLTIVYVSGEYK